MEQGKQIRLTSAELSQLVSQYMEDSASICALSYFLEDVEDTEIKPIIEHALQLSQAHVQKVDGILTEEKHKVPHGFKVEDDVNLTAQRLYADSLLWLPIERFSKRSMRLRWFNEMIWQIKAQSKSFYGVLLYQDLGNC